jgi:transposase InsO family protein
MGAPASSTSDATVACAYRLSDMRYFFVALLARHALFGLSKLAIWWLRLGIHIERIKPGHATQNGRHERIHLALKKEATKPAVQNLLQQQARSDHFMECYNRERQHQALGMKYPAEPFRPSPRPYRGLRDGELGLEQHRLRHGEGEPICAC